MLDNLSKLQPHLKLPKSAGYALLFAPLFYVLSGLFLQSFGLRLLLAWPTAWGPTHCLIAWLTARRDRLNRLYFGHFLQMLSSELAGGKTLSLAFDQVVTQLAQLSKNQSPFMETLLSAQNQLRQQVPLATLLARWAQQVPCEEAKPLLSALALQVKHQAPVHQLIQFSSTMIQELNETEAIVQSEGNKQTFEALLLVIMPYLLSLGLRLSAPQFAQQAFESILGQWVLAGAYFTALAASSLTLWWTAQGFAKPSRLKPHQVSNRQRRLQDSLFLQRLGLKILRLVLPKTRRLSLQQVLTLLVQQDPPAARQPKGSTALLPRSDQPTASPLASYAALLPIWGLLGLVFCLLLVGSGQTPVLGLLFMGGCFWGYLQAPFSRARQVETSLILSFPLFLGLTEALLQAGFVPRKALDLTLSFQKDDQTALGRLLGTVQRSFEQGASWRQVLAYLGRSCQVAELQAGLTLLDQFALNGSTDTLSLFRVQTQTIWRLARQTLRKKREQEHFRILIPMMGNLLSVLGMALAPVLVSFGL